MTAPDADEQARVWNLGARVVRIDPGAWVAPGAVVVGDVSIGAGASIWYGCVLRADLDSITVGGGSNLQDGVLVHTDPGSPVRVGSDVSVGHGAILHGCTVGDAALIGMGAIVLNGASVGAGAMVAAGALVPEGMVVPPGTLVMGSPARVRRELSAEESSRIAENAATYRQLSDRHRGEREAAVQEGTGSGARSEVEKHA